MTRLRHSQGLAPHPNSVSVGTTWLRDRKRDLADAGASLVEYALLLGLIAVVAVGALLLLGHNTTNIVNETGQFGSTTTTVANSGGNQGNGGGNGGGNNGNGNNGNGNNGNGNNGNGNNGGGNH